MKRVLRHAFFAGACIVSGASATQVNPYTIINPAQEKVRIIFKQLEVTYNWIDTIYAARERYYLSGIAIDYLNRQKNKCTAHQECSTLLNKLETVMEKLHVLDLSKSEFERIKCATEPLMQLPYFATKRPAVVVA